MKGRTEGYRVESNGECRIVSRMTVKPRLHHVFVGPASRTQPRLFLGYVEFRRSVFRRSLDHMSYDIDRAKPSHFSIYSAIASLMSISILPAIAIGIPFSRPNTNTWDRYHAQPPTSAAVNSSLSTFPTGNQSRSTASPLSGLIGQTSSLNQKPLTGPYRESVHPATTKTTNVVSRRSAQSLTIS